jgi:hypothetical protein
MSPPYQSNAVKFLLERSQDYRDKQRPYNWQGAAFANAVEKFINGRSVFFFTYAKAGAHVVLYFPP